MSTNFFDNNFISTNFLTATASPFPGDPQIVDLGTFTITLIADMGDFQVTINADMGDFAVRLIA